MRCSAVCLCHSNHASQSSQPTIINRKWCTLFAVGWFIKMGECGKRAETYVSVYVLCLQPFDFWKSNDAQRREETTIDIGGHTVKTNEASLSPSSSWWSWSLPQTTTISSRAAIVYCRHSINSQVPSLSFVFVACGSAQTHSARESNRNIQKHKTRKQIETDKRWNDKTRAPRRQHSQSLWCYSFNAVCCCAVMLI